MDLPFYEKEAKERSGIRIDLSPKMDTGSFGRADALPFYEKEAKERQLAGVKAKMPSGQAAEKQKLVDALSDAALSAAAAELNDVKKLCCIE